MGGIKRRSQRASRATVVLAVVAAGLLGLPADVRGEVNQRAAAPVLLSGVVSAPSSEGAATLQESSRKAKYLDLDPVEVTDDLVVRSRGFGEVDPETGCQSVSPNDLIVDLFGTEVPLDAVEAVTCPFDQDGSKGSYIEWHGQDRTARGDVLSVGAFGVRIDAAGRPTDVVGFFQHGQATFELMPAGSGLHTLIETDPSLAPEEVDHDHDHDSGDEGLDGGPVGDAMPGGGTDYDDAPVIVDDDIDPNAPGDEVEDGGASLVPGVPRPGGAPGNRTVQVLFAFTNGFNADQRALYTIHRTLETNNSFVNSGMPVRIQALGPVHLNYNQSASLSTDLNRLRLPSDGHMDSAWTMMVSTGADALGLFAPEARGACGIAYLNTRADSPSGTIPFGVTSVAPGCELTLTHEFGHTAGAHHNPESAGGATPGFPWAYGHYSSGRARTVMSYENHCASSCPRTAQFSDPGRSFIGFPGVASGTGYRNNRRAIMDMSWGLSQFGDSTSNDRIWYRNSANSGFTSHVVNGSLGNDMAAPYSTLSGDFNGDGRTDQFWYYPGSQTDYLWIFGASHGSYTSYAKNVVGNYRPVVGDFDGDGRDDILWHGPGSIPDSVWWGTASPTSFGTDVSSLSISGTFRPLAGDFDGDGRDDVFFYAPGTALDYVRWGHNHRPTFLGAPSTNPNVDGDYRATAGDVNGDGRDDIVWHRPGQVLRIWPGRTDRNLSHVYQTNAAISGSFIPHAGDFNGDGRDDVMFYAGGPSNDYIWWGQTSMAAFAAPHSSSHAVNGHYEATVGDFDGNGRDDIFWFAFG